MGRGLSPLQQQILRLAWEREQPTPGRRAEQRVLFPQEIFVRLYHWPVTHGQWEPDRVAGLAFRYDWHFQPSVIGPQPYHAVMVTVSRALDRLHARGLVARWGYGGWRLTAQGRACVQALMVD
jgi:hypothetical protein